VRRREGGATQTSAIIARKKMGEYVSEQINTWNSEWMNESINEC
jgi:hypothetical protein